MKKAFLIIFTACMMPLFSCSALIERQFDLLGENLEELGDELDDLGDQLDQIGDNIDDTATTYYYVDNGRNNHKTRIKISKKQISINKNDKLKTRKFDIKDYNAINVGYSFQVVMCDTVDSVTVRVNEKLDKYLIVKLSGGTLNVSLELIGGLKSDGSRCGYVYLPFNPKLSSFSLSGTATFATALPINCSKFNADLAGATSFKGKVTCSKCDIDLSGTSRCRTDIKCNSAEIELNGATRLECNIECTSLNADLSGTSKFKGNIKADNINADLSGASKILVAGTCNRMNADLSGTSSLDCKKLRVKKIDGDMSGATSATVTCSESLTMDLTGTSHLIYYGNPKTDIETSITASAERR